jgi:hypothetical protein
VFNAFARSDFGKRINEGYGLTDQPRRSPTGVVSSVPNERAATPSRGRSALASYLPGRVEQLPVDINYRRAPRFLPEHTTGEVSS